MANSDPDLSDDTNDTAGPLEVTSTAGALADAVTVASRTVVANPPLVAYTGVLITASRGRVTITASDGETTTAATVPTPGCTPGRALVAPKPLLTWLGSQNRDAEVTLTGEGADLHATVAGQRPYRFRGLSATFPDPRISRGGLTTADLSGLADAVAAVRHASDGTIRLRGSAEGLWLESTDYHRAAGALLRGVEVGDLVALAPLAPVVEMGRHPIDAIGLDGRGRELRAASEGVWIATRLSAETFPEVDALISGRPSRRMTVSTAELRVALRRLAAVADGAPTTITLGASEVLLEASNGDVGAGVEVVAADGDGGGFSCAAAVSYLADAVASHSTDRVELAWSDPLRPLYLSADDESTSRVAIVMPVRI